ncbi:hypothetical protein C5Y93_14165 [Blastopirellula marina]|uniref:Uncharacterized protein n=2 Tax=Blastopirellula marina TaxID=124 RepID=A0A2S8GMJ0_9BACT|nr:hypothetical protein C5Y93_14165 [Blastopirellula marina]
MLDRMNDAPIEDPWKSTLEVSSPEERKPRQWGLPLILAGMAGSYLGYRGVEFLPLTIPTTQLEWFWQVASVVACIAVPTVMLLVPGTILYIHEITRNLDSLRYDRFMWVGLAVLRIGLNVYVMYQLILAHRTILPT